MRTSFRFLAVSLFCAIFFNINANAQLDERKSGIYAIVDGKSVPLTYSSGIQHNASTGILGVELGKKKCTFRKPTSGTMASDTFVLVIDPEKKAVVRNITVYDPFIKSITPDDMLVLPLTVIKNKRVYEEGKTIAGINVSVKDRMEFEWEPISDNSFEIRVLNLTKGEYGFVFRPAKLGEFDYSAIFGFTISE